MKLKHVLSRAQEVRIFWDSHRADELKKAARFWVGKEANGFHKQQSVDALTKVFTGKNLAKTALPKLSDKQNRVLEIFARYGPVVSGEILHVEMDQRGLEEKTDDSSRSYYSRRNSVVGDLCNKFVLLGASDYYYYSFRRRYPELTLHRAIFGAFKSAKPLKWQSSASSPKAKSTFLRSSTEPALDLWRVSEALREMGNWKTVKGDALAKGSRNKLRKLVPLPSAETDEFSAPDPESLYYELLRDMEFLDVELEPRCVLSSAVEEHFAQPPVVQAWRWLRAWLNVELWQDGIGVVPDRDNDYDPVRIAPGNLLQAKELLTWALCGVAHSSLDWLDLEVFLKDFWKVTHEAVSSCYWHSYSWNPDFATARRKDSFPAGNERSLAFWLDSDGIYIANAIMVTHATLGLVERGETDGKTKQPCFRLTPLGRQVFGAPEIEAVELPDAEPFLTIQPNHEILAFLDAGDAHRVSTLAKFARCTSASTGRVQSFKLTRESIYSALENGMTLEEIETYLVANGKTELPANVLRMIKEWSGKRESLVLHSSVSVALSADKTDFEKLGSKSRELGEHATVLPNVSAKKAAQDFSGWSVLDHLADLPRVWQATELGELQSDGDDLISRQRLASIADRNGDGWVLTEKSVSRARQQGVTADQILEWLTQHLTHETPLLLAAAIRNWTGRASVFAGKVHLLQVKRADARNALLNSAAFQPLLAGHIPPDWFIVHDDKAKEAERMLKRFGFGVQGSYSVAEQDVCDEPKPASQSKPKRATRRRR